MRYVAMFALLLVLTGCGFGQAGSVNLGHGVGPGMCTSLIEHANGLPDETAREVDMNEAAKFCSVDQWVAEANRFPNALAGVDPVAYLRDFCIQRKTTVLCRSAAQRGLVSPGTTD